MGKYKIHTINETRLYKNGGKLKQIAFCKIYSNVQHGNAVYKAKTEFAR